MNAKQWLYTLTKLQRVQIGVNLERFMDLPGNDGKYCTIRYSDTGYVPVIAFKADGVPILPMGVTAAISRTLF